MDIGKHEKINCDIITVISIYTLQVCGWSDKAGEEMSFSMKTKNDGREIPSEYQLAELSALIRMSEPFSCWVLRK